jgi:hypothetical protein
MPLLIKICGITTMAAMDAALDAGADMVGVVFFPKSPRNVSLATGCTLAGRTCGRAGVVALTVDPDDDFLAAIAANLKPDMVQLHGHETPERVADIRARFKLRVMKAVGVAEAADLAAIPTYAAVSDMPQFAPFRARRGRQVRHLRRPLRRRDADALILELEQPITRPRPIRPSGGAGRLLLTHYVGRPSPLYLPSG